MADASTCIELSVQKGSWLHAYFLWLYRRFHKSVLLHLRVSLSQRCTVLTPKDPLEVVINKSHYYYVPHVMPARTVLSDQRRLLAAIVCVVWLKRHLPNLEREMAFNAPFNCMLISAITSANVALFSRECGLDLAYCQLA